VPAVYPIQVRHEKGMSDPEFFQRLKQNPRPVVVDFWAPWCGRCRAIEPGMKKLGEEFANGLMFEKSTPMSNPSCSKNCASKAFRPWWSTTRVRKSAGGRGATSLATLFEAALSGEKPVLAGPAPVDRLLRLVAGTALLVLAFINGFSGWYLLLALMGAGIAFTAVYDRCPIYRAVSGRLKAWLRKDQSGQ